MEGRKSDPMDELRKRYKDEWLVALVTKLDRYGLLSEGICWLAALTNTKCTKPS